MSTEQDAERWARVRLRLDALRAGATPAEADAIADALLPSMQGRVLVLRYWRRRAWQRIDGEVSRVLDRIARWLR